MFKKAEKLLIDHRDLLFAYLETEAYNCIGVPREEVDVVAFSNN